MSEKSRALPSGESLLSSLAKTLDLEKSIKELNISKAEAGKILKGVCITLRALPRSAPMPGAPLVKKAPSPSKGKSYELYVDGGSRGNPGPSGAGAVIIDPSGVAVKRLKKRLGRGTNNRAEYMALIMGLKAARALGVEFINIFADSELMVRQVSGRYKVKSPILKPLYTEVMALLSLFAAVKISHIPRASNKEADSLANEAMDAAR
ncbi:MAG: ribonuclease HI family protein [Thermodesulfobacteriota bacterium]